MMENLIDLLPSYNIHAFSALSALTPEIRSRKFFMQVSSSPKILVEELMGKFEDVWPWFVD